MCSRCEDLEDEIAWLRSELGLSVEVGDISALREAFGLTDQEARMLLMLRDVYPRALTVDQILERLPGKEDRRANQPTVLIHKIRKRTGKDSIVNVWGQGYALSATGCQQVLDVLPARTSYRRGAPILGVGEAA